MGKGKKKPSSSKPAAKQTTQDKAGAEPTAVDTLQNHNTLHDLAAAESRRDNQQAAQAELEAARKKEEEAAQFQALAAAEAKQVAQQAAQAELEALRKTEHDADAVEPLRGPMSTPRASPSPPLLVSLSRPASHAFRRRARNGRALSGRALSGRASPSMPLG